MKLNNEVAGFKFSVIGVLYAVLLAFVVIVVWENYNTTNAAVRMIEARVQTKMLLSQDRQRFQTKMQTNCSKRYGTKRDHGG